MKQTVAVFLVLLALAGCKSSVSPEEAAAPPVYPATATASIAPITVERVGMVRDKLAYDGYRGIYIIRDARTGKEYLGVSGIGISEVGSHTVGKSTQEDER